MSQEFINSVNYPAYNLFYLGSYSQVIHQLNNSIQSTADDKKDAKVLLYRTYLAQGKYSLISNELKGTDVEELKLIALSAELEQSKDASKREELLKQAEELANEGTNLLNPNLQLILARLAVIEGKLDIALKAVQLHPRHLECVSYSIQILLKLNRLDLAQKLFESTRSWSEDVPLLQLIEAWIDLAVGGGNKYQEALYIFEELSQQHNLETPKLLNSKANCHIHLNHYEEAEEVLIQALEKDNNDTETLINLIIVSNLLNKGKDVESRYLGQLKDINPNHPYLVQLNEKSDLFDSLASQYSPAAKA